MKFKYEIPIVAWLKVNGGKLLSNTLYALCVLVSAGTLAWYLLAKVDFLYPVWHDYTGIAAGIERFGPQNRYKSGFADTSAEQRYQIFAEINHSVHHGGEGLREISYQSASSGGAQALLREPEIEHLEDVAAVIDLAAHLAFGFMFLLLVLLVYKFKQRRGLPSFKQVVWGNFSLLAVLAVLVLILGPVKVFNQLHIWIFPGDHQWFFYYQDSLMSTMMLAPQLFAWIALALVGLSCVLLPLLCALATFLNSCYINKISNKTPR